MKLNSETLKTKSLGHLGLVAATINTLGIIEKIDERLPLNKKKGGIVSHGKRVAAMLLNGLGFMNSRLYMSPMFFHDKPVSTLLGEGITAEHLNDDSLGRCLDQIAQYGTTKLFSEIAFEIAREKNLLSGGLHLDTTSLTLYGEYDSAHEEASGPMPSLGYSKAQRPDLKQVVLSLTQMGPAHLPVWMEALHGNSSDKTSFHETVRKIEAFYKEIQDAPEGLCFIVDGAFYNAKKLNELSSVDWITRVPATLKAVKDYYRSKDTDFDWELTDDKRYQITTVPSPKDALDQRWIMVRSEPAYQREYKIFCKKMLTLYEALNKELWHLGNQYFGCALDAEKAIIPLLKKAKYFDLNYGIISEPLYEKKGRPKKTDLPNGARYRIEGNLISNLAKVQEARNELGRFILATNVIEHHKLSNFNILAQYKAQSHIESGFKFIKTTHLVSITYS